MTEKQVKPVKLTRAAFFFAVLAVLGFIAGTMAPIWSVFGGVFAVLAVLILLLWWINKRNGRNV
ncbi:hypothetical protein [Glutamicibacter arilaitensis]|uniref:hypothetical protein n=1 Tax=Glutamicibacter arilaitensis TaxID=256701 RepID=UPI00384CEBEC